MEKRADLKEKSRLSQRPMAPLAVIDQPLFSREETMLKQSLFFALFATSALAGNGAAAEFGTSDQAKAMLDRAVIEVRANKLSAIAKFNHNDPQFRDRDLFVFCFNEQDGKFTA